MSSNDPQRLHGEDDPNDRSNSDAKSTKYSSNGEGDANEDSNEKPSSQQRQGSLALVDWDGDDDPANPQNWSNMRKMAVTIIIASGTFTVSFGSSVISSATEVLAKQYDVGPTVATLSISLYVLGFAAGPWVWGPMSELIGRLKPFLIGYIAFMCFTVGVATAQNLYTIMICRFMQGAWGVSTITVVPGMLVDMWDSETRTTAMMSWAATIVVGPAVAPVIGGFTVENASLGWRWTMWLTLIISAVFLIPTLLFVRESWSPILLQQKAARLRRTTNWELHAKLDENPTDFRRLLETYGLKPMKMLFREPILLSVTLYNSFVYGIIYLTFEAYPYAFGTVRGWPSGVSTLPFLSLGIGFGLGFATAYIILRLIANNKKAKGQERVPEDQLWPMIVGSFVFIIGLFWFAWTSSPDIIWVPQVLSGGFIGAGVFLLFVSCQIYLLECYLANANSALAANTIARSLFAGGFPLFATQMYSFLGVPWATSLLAFLAIAMTPFPIIFKLYGAKIRSWSKFAF